MAAVNLRKALFRSPVEQEPDNTNGTELIMAKLHFEHDVETTLKTVKKDLHEQRLSRLRKKAENLSQDQWKYESIEKLLGFKP